MIDPRKLLTLRTLAEVGQILGMSRQAVQQTERVALRKVRVKLLEAVREDVPWAADIVQRDVLERRAREEVLARNRRLKLAGRGAASATV
jgi:hypothetical protein